MNRTLAGKVALITGASRGIGRAVAQRLAAAGAHVAITYASLEQRAAEVVNTIKTTGGEAALFHADLSRASDIQGLFDEVETRFHGLDILVVSGSAPIVDKPLTAITEQEFDQVFALNVKGTFLALQQAAKRIRQNGRIITFSTPYVVQPQAQRSVTAGSKAVSDQFSLTLARELGSRGITVNCVMPGPTDTDSFRSMVPEGTQQQLLQMIPLGRIGKAEDIADVVVFLVSEEAHWITGQTIRATGGLL